MHFLCCRENVKLHKIYLIIQISFLFDFIYPFSFSIVDFQRQCLKQCFWIHQKWDTLHVCLLSVLHDFISYEWCLWSWTNDRLSTGPSKKYFPRNRARVNWKMHLFCSKEWTCFQVKGALSKGLLLLSWMSIATFLRQNKPVGSKSLSIYKWHGPNGNCNHVNDNSSLIYVAIHVLWESLISVASRLSKCMLDLKTNGPKVQINVNVFWNFKAITLWKEFSSHFVIF